jgi:hypothetical protein
VLSRGAVKLPVKLILGQWELTVVQRGHPSAALAAFDSNPHKQFVEFRDRRRSLGKRRFRHRGFEFALQAGGCKLLALGTPAGL